jgi:hypothetical protein
MFLLFAAAAAHSTPHDRIVLDLLLVPGVFLGRSCRLSIGQIVRLTYLLPTGVLSILNRDGFRLYFGFSDNWSDPLQWFEPPQGASGFYSFGGSREAVVEIIALKDIDIVFSGCYIEDCQRIAAASTATVHNSHRTCFFATDLASEVRVHGSAVGASIGVWTPSLAAVYNISNPIPANGIQSCPFNIISIGTDSVASQKYTIEFRGTEQAFAFDTFDVTAGRAIIGVAVRLQFQPVTGEFEYPDIDPDRKILMLACVISAAVVGLLVFVYAFLCWIGFICAKGTDGTQITAQLYDPRPDICDDRSDTRSSEESKKKKNTPQPWGQSEPASPYDTL